MNRGQIADEIVHQSCINRADFVLLRKNSFRLLVHLLGVISR